MQVQALPTEQAAPVLTDSVSRGYDPCTHACNARPPTTVGRTSLSVINIIICPCATQFRDDVLRVFPANARVVQTRHWSECSQTHAASRSSQEESKLFADQLNRRPRSRIRHPLMQLDKPSQVTLGSLSHERVMLIHCHDHSKLFCTAAHELPVHTLFLQVALQEHESFWDVNHGQTGLAIRSSSRADFGPVQNWAPRQATSFWSVDPKRLLVNLVLAAASLCRPYKYIVRRES